MAKKSKKSPPRRAAVKRKSKAKSAKRTKTKRAPAKRAAAPRKKIVRRKKVRKPESRLEKIENAIEVGVAKFDDLAMSLGLIAGSSPLRKSRK